MEYHCSQNSCDCVVGYYGDSCTEECIDEIHCNNHGHCTKYGSCLCDDGYDGIKCEIPDKSYVFLIIVLVASNAIIACLWYRQRVNGIPNYLTIRILQYVASDSDETLLKNEVGTDYSLDFQGEKAVLLTLLNGGILQYLNENCGPELLDSFIGLLNSTLRLWQLVDSEKWNKPSLLHTLPTLYPVLR